MSFRTKAPKRVIGGVALSGHVNTGEQAYTRGGQQVHDVYSGALLLGSGTPVVNASGGHALLVSGAGRLHTAFLHQSVLALSGVATYFYDSAVIARSGVGTIPESGYPIIAAIGQAQGASGDFIAPLSPMPFDTPFHSGLCVSNPSGAAGWSISVTREQRVLSGGGGADLVDVSI